MAMTSLSLWATVAAASFPSMVSNIGFGIGGTHVRM
jgi:hypothetical protein